MLVASIPIQGVTVRHFPSCQDILLQAKCCLHNPGRTGKPRICSLRGLSIPLRSIFKLLQVAESRERNALPALQGQSPKRVLSKGEDAPPAQCFPPSHPSPAVSTARPSPSIAHRSILPAADVSVFAGPNRGSPRPSGQCPALPFTDLPHRKQKIAVSAVNPLPAASSLTAHSPPYTAAYIV